MNQNELDNTTGKNHTGHQANKPVRILTASSIVGDKIRNPSGEHLGKIYDIMLNIESGCIEYVIIAFGGFMGMQEKYFAIPFDALTIDTQEHEFIFDQTRKSFEDHPGFNKDHWPEANFHSTFSGYSGGFMGPNTGADH